MRGRFLIGVALIAGLAVAGTKGYLWYKVKSAADDLIQAAAPFAEISYDGIHTTFSGEVGVKHLLIKPRGIPDEIRAEALIVQAPNLLFLFTAAGSFEQGRLPEKFGVVLQGLELKMDCPIAGFFAAAERQPQGLALPLETCGSTRIGPRQLIRMGYTRTVSDIEFGYVTLSPSSFAINMGFATRGMGELYLDGRLNGVADNLSQMGAARPTISRLRVHYGDRGYNSRLAEYCTASLQISKEAYLARQQAAIEELLKEIGVMPEQPLEPAVAELFGDGGKLEIVLSPTQPLSPGELQFYRPHQRGQILQPELNINGKPVALIGYSGTRSQTPAAVAQAEPAKPANTGTPAAPAVKGPAMQEARFRRVETAELGRHLGWPARFTLTSGRRIEGVLEEARENSVVITRRFSNGTMSHGVNFDEVEQVEVLR